MIRAADPGAVQAICKLASGLGQESQHGVRRAGAEGEWGAARLAAGSGHLGKGQSGGQPAAARGEGHDE